MKKIIHFLLFLAITALCNAQKEQDPDTLLWNNRKYLAIVHRDVPSVVQIYYQRSGADIPFNHWSSNNNRGHVATLEILDNRLCLKTIEAKRFKTRRGNLWAESGIDTTAHPNYFGINSLHTELLPDSSLVCDWFSGIMELVYIPHNKKDAKNEEANGHRYLNVSNGNIVENTLITNDDRKAMDSKPGQNKYPNKQALLDNQKRFIELYRRCYYDYETVSFQGHKGIFEHKNNSLTLAMELFNNDPSAVTGPLFGTYIIINDSLFLKALTTHSGSLQYSYDSTDADISMAGNVINGRVHASWVDGDYVIQYGTWTTDDFGTKRYNVERTQKIRFKNGLATSSRFSPKGFDDDDSIKKGETTTPCNPETVYAVDYKMLTEAIGKHKEPKKTPYYDGDKELMRNYFAKHPLTDDRAKERLFRVVIAFIVNCNGEAGQWQIITKGRGELAEYANMVLEVVRNMPQRWKPATDRKGNPVDCWQVLEFTVSKGLLTSANYR